MLKIAGGHSTPVFAVAFLLVGLGLALALYALLAALGLRPWIAAAIAIAFTISPPAIVYENFLFYDYPVTALMVASALALHRLVRRPSLASGTAFFAAVAALVLTRSVFQLPWVVLVIVVAVLACPRRRLVLASAVVPIALVLAVYAKNLAEFDTFSTSSWYGMSLASTTMEHVPPEELRGARASRRRLLARARLPVQHARGVPRLVHVPPGRAACPCSIEPGTGPRCGTTTTTRRTWPSRGSTSGTGVSLHGIAPVPTRPGWRTGRGCFFDPSTSLRAFRLNDNLAELGAWHETYTRVLFSAKRVGIRFRLIAVLWVLTMLYATVRLPWWLRDRRRPAATRATLAYIWLAVRLRRGRVGDDGRRRDVPCARDGRAARALRAAPVLDPGDRGSGGCEAC